MTIEQAQAELKAVTEEFFGEVVTRMDGGDNFATARWKVRQARPDLTTRENQLYGYIRAMGRAAVEIDQIARQIQASGASKASVERFLRPCNGAISCAAVTALAGAAKRLPIAMMGVRYKGSQKIEITRAMLDQVVANFRKRITGEVPIDYDHSMEFSAGSGGPVPAAGWIKSIDGAPDAGGILWGSVEWTADAARMIAAKQYKYISPVIDPNGRDGSTGKPQGWTLTSAALTNTPVLGMPALVLSEIAPGRGYERSEEMQADNEWDAVQLEVVRRTKQVMAERGLDYAAAMRWLMLDDCDLSRRYSTARIQNLGGSGFKRLQDENLGSEIQAAVSEKVAASEGRLNYGAALTYVLSNRPDLARRYKDSLR